MSTGQQRAVWSLLRTHPRTLFIECISGFLKISSENHCQTSAFMENLPKSEVDLNSELSELLAFKTFLQASSLSFISFPLYSCFLSFLLSSSPCVSLSLLPLPFSLHLSHASPSYRPHLCLHVSSSLLGPSASFPAPRMCSALHGQIEPWPISTQSPGNTKKLPDTRTGRARGGQEDSLITDSRLREDWNYRVVFIDLLCFKVSPD